MVICWICVLGVNGETETNYKTANDKNEALKKLAVKQEIHNDKWIDAMGKEFDVSSAKKLEPRLIWYMSRCRRNTLCLHQCCPSSL